MHSLSNCSFVYTCVSIYFTTMVFDFFFKIFLFYLLFIRSSIYSNFHLCRLSRGNTTSIGTSTKRTPLSTSPTKHSPSDGWVLVLLRLNLEGIPPLFFAFSFVYLPPIYINDYTVVCQELISLWELLSMALAASPIDTRPHTLCLLLIVFK